MNQNISITESDLPVAQLYVDLVNAIDSVEVIHTSKWFNAASVRVTDSSYIDSILALSFVVGVDTVKKYYMKQELVQKNGGHSGYYDTYYGTAFRQIEIMNGHLLHEDGYKGAGLRIGVLDAGFTNVDQLEVFQPMYNAGRLIATKDVVDGNNVYDHSQPWYARFIVHGCLYSWIGYRNST